MENNILQDLFGYIFKQEITKLVGKTCKRFEISDDKNEIKKNVKELIYEFGRDVEDMIKTGKVTIKLMNESQSKEKKDGE